MSKLFRLEEGVASNIASYFAGLTAELSPYLDSYPRPLPADELASIPGLWLTSVDAPFPETAATLIFCGRRVVEEREPRTRAEIGDEAINRFGWQNYDEFVLVKRRFEQSYEVVRVDVAGNLLELRVEDHTGVDSAAALQQLQEKVNEVLSVNFPQQLLLNASVNLFPAIRSIYDDPSEGTIVELGFTTETGSAKHEKMRSSRLDLRHELFHVGGKAAVNGILTPFRVAVRWSPTDQRNQEEALLPGSIRQLGSPSPFLDHMVLSGCLTEAMMQAAVQRVVSHLYHP